MPQQTRIFRVFVSSTFTDMKEERRILQKKVFPKLEAFCDRNNAKFQAVDNDAPGLPSPGPQLEAGFPSRRS
jgi:hypothetical protein